MTITITLPPATEQRFRAEAEASGKDISILVVEALNEEFEEQTGTTPNSLPYEQWAGEFQAWIASQKSRNPQFDDSRESIYD